VRRPHVVTVVAQELRERLERVGVVVHQQHSPSQRRCRDLDGERDPFSDAWFSRCPR
jgi:hypothetical protein